MFIPIEPGASEAKTLRSGQAGPSSMPISADILNQHVMRVMSVTRRTWAARLICSRGVNPDRFAADRPVFQGAEPCA
jgi:hypothetical protein